MKTLLLALSLLTMTPTFADEHSPMIGVDFTLDKTWTALNNADYFDIELCKEKRKKKRLSLTEKKMQNLMSACYGLSYLYSKLLHPKKEIIFASEYVKKSLGIGYILCHPNMNSTEDAVYRMFHIEEDEVSLKNLRARFYKIIMDQLNINEEERPIRLLNL